jgi:hypothetical protein
MSIPGKLNKIENECFKMNYNFWKVIEKTSLRVVDLKDAGYYFNWHMTIVTNHRFCDEIIF